MKAARQRNPKPPRVALPGSTYGSLAVLSDAPKVNGERYVNVVCECGTQKVVRVTSLTMGITKTCGGACKASHSMAQARAAKGKRREAGPFVPFEAPRPKRLPMAPVTCKGGCNHDGRMMPGGSEDGRERDNKCMHYSACELAFVKAYRDARTAHCQPHCPKWKDVAPPPAATDGWAAMLWPG